MRGYSNGTDVAQRTRTRNRRRTSKAPAFSWMKSSLFILTGAVTGFGLGMLVRSRL